MSKHTPGPWVVREDERTEFNPFSGCDESHVAGFDIDAASGRSIVGCEGILPGDEDYANACLIASCPDLLQMLHECAEYIAALNGEKDDYCQRARALIARATGEEK